jgi:predicted metal-dependent hydrolase
MPKNTVERSTPFGYTICFPYRALGLSFNNLESPRVAELLRAGIFFFNAGRYFEAHEAWEDLWRTTRGPLRLFYQGLVQAAVGMHHLSRGNPNGGRAQITKSLAKLEQYPAAFCQIDNEKLTSDLRRVLNGPDVEQFKIREVS